MIHTLFQQGIITCFAYGQTGSGKTFTMKGVQEAAVNELFDMAKRISVNFSVSFFEIYGGHLFDLLNNRNKLTLLEDKNQTVQVQGLVENSVNSVEEMLNVIDYGHSVRTTHATTSNDTSSRSHAICQIIVRSSNNDILGKLLLVDLAVIYVS